MSGGAALKQENIFHLDCEQSKQKDKHTWKQVAGIFF